MRSAIQDLYHQDLTRKRKRVFFTKTVWAVLGLAVALGGALYVFLFSPLFRIRDISINGLSNDRKELLLGEINQKTEEKYWNIFKPYRNILIFNAQDIGQAFADTVPMIQNVEVKKNYLHGLEFNFIEREPIGIWCFSDNCQYFDREGKLLGKALESSGFVYLTVKDDRTEQVIDPKLLQPILLVVKKLPDFDVHVTSVRISKNSLAEFRVHTNANYDLIFSLDSNMSQQLEVLRIFLSEKRKSPAFAPQYIDLRIDGRVYYK